MRLLWRTFLFLSFKSVRKSSHLEAYLAKHRTRFQLWRRVLQSGWVVRLTVMGIVTNVHYPQRQNKEQRLNRKRHVYEHRNATNLLLNTEHKYQLNFKGQCYEVQMQVHEFPNKQEQCGFKLSMGYNNEIKGGPRRNSSLVLVTLTHLLLATSEPPGGPTMSLLFV